MPELMYLQPEWLERPATAECTATEYASGPKRGKFVKCSRMGRLYRAGEVENRANVLCDKHATEQYKRLLGDQLFDVRGVVARTRNEVYSTDVLIP